MQRFENRATPKDPGGATGPAAETALRNAATESMPSGRTNGTRAEEEVKRITHQIEEGTLKPKSKIEFEKGENVRVVSGPFSSFTGIVDNVNEQKGKLRVLVSIFGGATPIELDFTQVEKTT